MPVWYVKDFSFLFCYCHCVWLNKLSLFITQTIYVVYFHHNWSSYTVLKGNKFGVLKKGRKIWGKNVERIIDENCSL